MKELIKDSIPIFLGVLIVLCLMFMQKVDAQTIETSIGAVTFMPDDSAQVAMSHKTYTVSRDLLADASMPGSYQWVTDDLEAIRLFAQYEGVSFEVPPLQNDSLIAALDSLTTLAANVQAELDQRDQTISQQEQTIAERDQTIANLQDQLAQQSSQIASLESQVTEAQALASERALRIDELEAEQEYTIGVIRQVNRMLQNR